MVGRVWERKILFGPGLLTARRSTWSRILLRHIGHQLYFDATVLSASCGSLVVGDCIVLTNPDEIKLVRGDVVLRREIVDNRIGAALAQLIVVLSVPN